jgi:hypothetical protein
MASAFVGFSSQMLQRRQAITLLCAEMILLSDVGNYYIGSVYMGKYIEPIFISNMTGNNF